MEESDSLIEKIKEAEKELIKQPIRTRQEIITAIFETKIHSIGLEPFKDRGHIAVANTPLSRFLRERGVSEEIIRAIIAGLEEEMIDEETIMDIAVAAMDSPNDLQDPSFSKKELQSWPTWAHSFLEMSSDDWLHWIARMLEVAKLSIESINSIMFGLELNLESAKNAAALILSRLGISAYIIEWIFEKIRAPDNEGK